MEIQKSLYIQLQSGDVSQNFFRVFHDAMDAAQAEIKSTVTVNTSDMAARAHEENNNNNTTANQAGLLKNSKGKYSNGNLVMTEELKDELDMATYSTQQAYMAVRGGAGGSQGTFLCSIIDNIIIHFKILRCICFRKTSIHYTHYLFHQFQKTS